MQTTLATTCSITTATAWTVESPEPEEEGLRTAGERYLISDRDLDALGLALMAWEDHAALVQAAAARAAETETDRAA